MIRKTISFSLPCLWLLAGAFLLSSCNKGPSTEWLDQAPLISKTFTDDLKREVSLQKLPKKVISLAPNITEMIFALGGEDLLVGRSHICDYPVEAEDLPAVNIFPTLDFPRISELEPELVLTSDEVFEKSVVRYFDEFRIPVYFQTYTKLEDIYRNIFFTSKLLGKEQRGKQMTDSLRRLQQSIADSTKGQIKYSTMILINTDPLEVIGGKSYITEMLEVAGGKNAFGNIDEKFPQVTPEAVIQAAPEYLILPSESPDILASLTTRYPELANKLPALANNQIFQMEPDLLLRPGPRTVDGIIYLTRLLHPRILIETDKEEE